MVKTSAYSGDFIPYARIRVEPSNYAHQQHVTKALEELVQLERGWDGYRAEPVNFDNANYALRILEKICSDNTPPPDIVPGVSGDLQLEWHTDSVEIELHIISPNHVLFWANDSQACPQGEEILITGSDFTGVSSQLDRLMGIESDRAATA